MLTSDKLKAVEVLKGLTDDQIKAISALSEADENKTISENRSRWWSRLDQDVEEITGAQKPGEVKSYQVLREVLTDLNKKAQLAGKSAELQKAIEEKESEISTLKEQIKSGGGMMR